MPYLSLVGLRTCCLRYANGRDFMGSGIGFGIEMPQIMREPMVLRNPRNEKRQTAFVYLFRVGQVLSPSPAEG